MSNDVLSKKSSTETDSVDVARLIGELVDHRKLIITIVSVFGVLAIIYALFSTPIYQANALIQLEQKQGNALLSNLSQILPDSTPESAPEIALLNSRMILGKTVDDLDLQADVKQKQFPIVGRGFARMMGEKPGNISVKRLYLPTQDDEESSPVVIKVDSHSQYTVTGEGFSYKGTVGQLLEQKEITILVDRIDSANETEFKVKYLTKLKAINELQDIFSASDSGKDSGILNLTVIGDNKDRIEKILNSITQNYLAQNIARQAAQDAKSLDFLDQQLPVVRNDLDVAEGKLNSYRQQKDSVDLTLEAKATLDQIVNVDNQLNELTFRESEVSQLFTKEHPTYKALMEKRKTLQDEKGKLNKRVSAMPATQQEVLRLSRDVESGRAVYMQLLNRQQELSIAKSSAIGNVRIIDDAVTEPKPIKPKKILVVLIGLVLGIAFSFSLVLLRVFLRRGIESPEQLEDLGVNVYASIPVSESFAKNNTRRKKKNESNEYANFLAIENPADVAIEAIRGLRTSLHFAMMEAKNKVLLISGASPNAGKTFVSSNLAEIVAQTGKKVLFIDTDMRKGYAHKLFRTDNNNGLSDVLSGKVSIEKAIKPVPGANFDFICRGATPPNPAELLMHSNYELMIKWANENYDIIIVDTPPILAVTDAAIAGRYAGTVLVVARFEENSAKEIEVSIKRFVQSGVAIKGCILNGVVKKSSSYYGYGYDHYGYKYTDK